LFPQCSIAAVWAPNQATDETHLQAFCVKPSDGLEPSTPSLPCAPSGKRSQPMATVFGSQGGDLLQRVAAHRQTPCLPWNFSGNRWQPTATVFACFSRFRGGPICHRLPAVATALLHKCSILCSRWRQRRAGRRGTSIPSLLGSGQTQISSLTGSGERTLVHQAVRLTLTRNRSRTNETGRNVRLPEGRRQTLRRVTCRRRTAMILR
jgi:hypothetical protein